MRHQRAHQPHPATRPIVMPAPGANPAGKIAKPTKNPHEKLSAPLGKSQKQIPRSGLGMTRTLENGAARQPLGNRRPKPAMLAAVQQNDIPQSKPTGPAKRKLQKKALRFQKNDAELKEMALRHISYEIKMLREL